MSSYKSLGNLIMNLREKGAALTHEDLKVMQVWQEKEYKPDELAALLVKIYDDFKTAKKPFPRDLKRIDRMIQEMLLL